MTHVSAPWPVPDDAAVSAAAQAISQANVRVWKGDDDGLYRRDAQAAITAAAPHIQAATLRQAAERYRAGCAVGVDGPTFRGALAFAATPPDVVLDRWADEVQP